MQDNPSICTTLQDMAEKMVREQSVTVRLNQFELELLRLVEEEAHSTLPVLKRSRAIQYGVLLAAYQRCGAMAVARARKKLGLSFEDMKGFYLDPEDSLRALEQRFVEVDGIPSSEK